jgi:hypothetical protein
MTTTWHYRKRPIGLIERWEPNPNTVCKIYGISTTGPGPRPELIAAAKPIAADLIPSGGGDNAVNPAVMICHDAGESCWALIQWWVDSCILRSYVYRADGNSPGELIPAPAGITACIWELEVIDFERRAWTDNMLTADTPNLDGYLAAEINTEM